MQQNRKFIAHSRSLSAPPDNIPGFHSSGAELVCFWNKYVQLIEA